MLNWFEEISISISVLCHCSAMKRRIAVTSWWGRWRVKSLASRLFNQPLFQAPVKENIKAPCHWPLWWPMNSPLKGPITRKMFQRHHVVRYLMTTTPPRTVHLRSHPFLMQYFHLNSKSHIGRSRQHLRIYATPFISTNLWSVLACFCVKTRFSREILVSRQWRTFTALRQIATNLKIV